MLTDVAIRRARSGPKPYKMVDGQGMHVLIQPNGSKLFQYRYRLAGKPKTASLGRYPEVGLREARERLAEARKLVAQGIDPVAAKNAKRAAQIQAGVRTFETAARLWLEDWRKARSTRHAEYVQRRLQADVLPVIGAHPIEQVTAPRLVEMVKRVERRGAADVAKRILQTCGQVFRYAIAHGWASRNPAADIRPGDVLIASKKKNFARVDSKELPALMRRIEAYQGTQATRLAMKLMAFTFVRTTELIGARWEEFDFEARRWDIPAARMKMKQPHVVPLSDQAIEVLRTLQEVSGNRDLLFPGERDHTKPMSNNTILAALERMGYKGRMTGHGFRGVASTILHENGFEHAHIELQLAHLPRDQVSAAYNWATYLPQRGEMMQWWGDYLESITRGKVAPMRRAA